MIGQRAIEGAMVESERKIAHGPDGDGVADRVSAGTSDGGTRGYTMAGPGFEVRDLPWDLTRIP